ncbi:MAG TPA: HAMP domain-containing sensor histidine kinase [Verrucomicrobiae bacterium]|nr:HAMP domain-containing sensor histidine kinase [Verrucomicrobiae bacterium]
MKKVAAVFVLAVFVPSLVLAWLALRSLRDQQFLLERQQSSLYQGVADGLARDVQSALADDLNVFAAKLSALLQDAQPADLAANFDERLRQNWPLAQVGFVVAENGELLSPSTRGRPQARSFIENNRRFLANRESAAVYWNQNLGKTPLAANNLAANNPDFGKATAKEDFAANNAAASRSAFAGRPDGSLDKLKQRLGTYNTPRSVIPQQQAPAASEPGSPANSQDTLQAFSKLVPSEAEFRQLIGQAAQGMLARFVDNQLSLLFWCRPASAPNLIFGAQLDLANLKSELGGLLGQLDPALRQSICVALLDDNARPAALSHPFFHANWKRPFVATEIGETLPHWEVAVYLLDPAKLAHSAQTLKVTLGLLIGLLVFAIGSGSWLIVADLNRQLVSARQKTDFVSNVSHELKTPLTSIRMFSELLAEGRVTDPARQRSYLSIIAAETARLTRLINNVLDFARTERGQKRYRFQKCDLLQLVRELTDTYRPHLEAEGFRFQCALPAAPIVVNADRDALAQVVLNLLSNAEKYSGERKEILLRLEQQSAPLPHLELAVLDRGLGVPPGAEEKIFEKFYRAHDALSCGIQGSGLGLTLARQIARAHGGEILYAPREGGGSCFSLRLPAAEPPPQLES